MYQVDPKTVLLRAHGKNGSGRIVQPIYNSNTQFWLQIFYRESGENPTANLGDQKINYPAEDPYTLANTNRVRYNVILRGINIILTLSTLSVLTECCFIGLRSNNKADQEATGMDWRERD